MSSTLQLGVIGLGTMGGNLARNAARNGATVAVFNRTKEKLTAFIAAHGNEGNFIACSNYKALAKTLQRPRPVLLMVKAGQPVDEVIDGLLKVLDKGDIIIDAGNSHFRDTERRAAILGKRGVRFIGMGVSGGEEGALKGPSMMLGGDKAAATMLLPLFSKMAAKSDKGSCIAYFGPGGAGHFVKMVHNGIEYGLMQIIAETYDGLRVLGKFPPLHLSGIFSSWLTTKNLKSFLLEITADILRTQDPLTKKFLLDRIKDSAAQKGTGRWTTDSAMEFGVAIPTINAAVDARILSSETERRERLSGTLPEALLPSRMDRASLMTIARDALELASICTYAQGFELLAKAGAEQKWDLHLDEVARVWRGGCIIRSSFLKTLQLAHQSKGKNAATEIFSRFKGNRQKHWRLFAALAVSRGIPIPALSASLSFYDALRAERLPQNLIQAQRDYFGAHMYERTDRKGLFHTEWN